MPTLPRDPAALASAVTALHSRRQHRLLLELDLTEEISDAPPADPLGQLMALRRPQLRDLVDALRRAAEDPRVVGLIAKVGGRHPMARVQELRDAVLALRATGKPATAWAETFGEAGPGTLPYYLATAFDEIWLQPSGDLALTGLAMETPFGRAALERAGIEAQFEARHEYKNAPNTFTQDDFTAAHREQMQALVGSLASQVVEGIAAARQLAPARVRGLVDDALLSAEQAQAAGLIDRVGYRDEAYAAARARGRTGAPGGDGADAELLFLTRYAKQGGPVALARKLGGHGKPGVALINLHGQIRLGRNGRVPLSGAAAGSDSVTGALRAAIRADDVKAIVLRVDSPGGSYAASDAIWRHVVLARRHGKPVVVSMGAVAASGGYFVAVPADAIVAQPGTITGSIGVYSGKFVTTGLLDRIGVHFGAVAEGEHALMFSSRYRYTAEEQERIARWLDRVYADFVAKVADGRGLTRERAHELARGRVWSGADAAERGLVDHLGGLDRALELAREKAGLGPSAPVRTLPHVSPVERLVPARSSEDPRAAETALRLEAWGPLAALAQRLGLPAGGPLMLPERPAIG